MKNRTAAVTSPFPKDGERRYVTVLFADLVGFTAFTASAGAENAYSVMQRVSKLLNDTVQEQGCVIKNFTGDGIVAFFGAPVALEDGPLRACRAALLIEQRLACAAAEIETRHGMRPQLRMSINSGLVVVGQVTERELSSVTAHGDIVNVGSRLLSAAEPGTILIGEETQRFVAGLVETRDAGTFQFKGKAEPQHAYRLLALPEYAKRFDRAQRRGLTEFVGRDGELHVLDTILRKLHSVCAVDISGDPGIGKSRLLHEFRKHLTSERAIVLRGGCSPDSEDTPFHPVLDAVRRGFRLAGHDTDTMVSAKIAKGLSILGLGSPRNCALLLNLLGLPVRGALPDFDGALIGMRTRDLLLQLIMAASRLSKVVVVLEDLHWIDNASEELLTSIIGCDDALPVLIVCTRRPEYRPPWYDRPRVVPLALAPLSEMETLRIVGARLGVTELPEGLGRLVAAKADGNALFAEEIAGFLVERGIVHETASGLAYHAPAVAAALPGSLHSLLTARVDRLPVADRRLLQVAAVIGRRFHLQLVAAIVRAPDIDIATRLASMEGADIVRRDASSDSYAFKHALVRDALYDSLLSAARADLHLKVAQVIEQLSAERIIEVAETLAYHYSFTGASDTTFRYLCLAGRKCLDTYSLEEAVQHFRHALDVYDTMAQPENGCDIAKAVVGLLESLYLSGNVLETKSVAECYIPRLEKSAGESPELVFALYFLSLMLANLCEFRKGETTARQAVTLAEKTGEVKAIAYARSSLFFLMVALGRMSREAMEVMAAQLVADCEKAADNYILNWAYWSIAWGYLQRGLVLDARSWVEKLMKKGCERMDKRALGMAYWTLSWIEILGGTYEKAAINADEAAKTATAPFDRNAAGQVKAAAMLLQGRHEEGLRSMRNTRQWALDNGWLYSASGVDMSMSAALALSGDLRSAVALLRASIKSADANESRIIASWNRIFLAELYLGALTAKRRPPLRDILRNLPTIFGIVLFGARRARTLLAEARQNEQFDALGIVAARIELDLGMLARYEKRLGNARDHFARARSAAVAQNADVLMQEVDAAVAALK